MRPVALTVAGSDPSGGAGLQADLHTFHQHGVYGCAVVSLVTVQNTQRLSRVRVLDAELVAEQLDAVLEDLAPVAAKTGALGSAPVVCAVAKRFARTHSQLVVDPVRMAKKEVALLAGDARSVLLDSLLPVAALITPNAAEAQWLSELPVRDESEAIAAAERLCSLGARAVLVKGGHLQGEEAVDVLLLEGKVHCLRAPRLAARHTHGVGCSYSAAITARLALGDSLLTACERAKQWITRAIASAPGLGRGTGAVDHFAEVAPSAPGVKGS
jgi:hydroxymethylpyrimidine/phosphomethylpyrimidine kinase